MKDMTLQEAADRLGLDASHVRRLLRAGTIKGEKFGERVWRVNRASVELYARTERHPGVQPRRRRQRKDAVPA